jgi:hypothetical protein
VEDHTKQRIKENVWAWWTGYWMTTFTIFIIFAACVRGCVHMLSQVDWQKVNDNLP